MSLAFDRRAEELEWARCNGSCAGGTSETTGFFLGGLVKGKFYFDGTTGGLEPLFFTVDVWDYVVVFYHFGELVCDYDSLLFVTKGWER